MGCRLPAAWHQVLLELLQFWIYRQRASPLDFDLSGPFRAFISGLFQTLFTAFYSCNKKKSMVHIHLSFAPIPVHFRDVLTHFVKGKVWISSGSTWILWSWKQSDHSQSRGKKDVEAQIPSKKSRGHIWQLMSFCSVLSFVVSSCEEINIVTKRHFNWSYYW